MVIRTAGLPLDPGGKELLHIEDHYIRLAVGKSAVTNCSALLQLSAQ